MKFDLFAFFLWISLLEIRRWFLLPLRMFCVRFGRNTKETASKPPPPPSIYISYSINFTLKHALHHRIGNHLSSFCETIKRVYVCILFRNIGSAPQLLDNYCSNRKYVGTYLTQIQILFEKSVEFVMVYMTFSFFSVTIRINFFHLE